MRSCCGRSTWSSRAAHRTAAWPTSRALAPSGQFQPTTFRAYGIDADGNGRADICGFADSLFSAARYLRALGADGNLASAATWRALARYGTDPGLVFLLAR